MKSEKEFLDCMWDRVYEIEYEELQKQLAKVRSAAIIKKNILLYSSIIILYAVILFITLCTAIPDSMSIVFAVAFIALIAGYFIDRGIYNNK